MAKKPSALIAEEECLSFWIGKFSSEAELERFVDESKFEKEQGFTIEPPFLPFNAFAEGPEPRQLLGILMQEPRLLDVALKVLPPIEFNAVIRHEHFRFDAMAAPKGKKRMTFLGTFKSRDSR